MTDEDFDGRVEIDMRLERGASFGLSKATYARMAQASISAERCAGIHPSEMRRLTNGEGGAIVTLYGSHSQCEIKVEVRIARMSLSLLPLDSAAPTEIFSGREC